ncbi:MAG TPA: TolC family outer membrane protein [Burkholderiales bacterium]|nr:TolC family outer membrane protein [Burkholderiales bacterium]
MTRMPVIALLVACSFAARAADLLDVFRQAQSADTTYAAARAAWAAAQERIPQARASFLPLASLSASAQTNDRSISFRDNVTPRSSGDFRSTGLTLSVTQPLYRPQYAFAYQQALTQVGQADAQLALAAQDLILRVAQAYFDILLAQDNVAFAGAQKTAIGQQLEQAKRNFEVGTATITDTHEAQARYDLTIAQEIAARNELELRRRALEQIIARNAPPLAPLGARFILKSPEPATMDSWVGLAQQANLQVRVAQSALAFAAHEIDRNRAAHFPTLDAFATLSESGTGVGITGGTGNDTRTAVAGVQLALPIYQGGAINSRVREAIAGEDRARQDLETARRTAEFTARQSFLGITNGMAQVRALEAALVSTESQLASTRLGQEVGVRTQVDILNAQQQLFSARRDLAQSKYTYVMSLLRLEAAIGELTEEDVLAVNQWLDKAAATTVAQATAPAPATRTTPTAVPETPAAVPATPSAIKDEPEIKPAAALPAPPPQIEKANAADTAEVLRTLESWARAWSTNDVPAYLASYADDFETPRGMSRSAWEAERTARIQKPRKIEVSIESPRVTLESADRARVLFRQIYRSGPTRIASDKLLVMVRRAGQWLIQQERVEAEKRM